MILLLFAAAVLVSVVLERQARRHRLQRAIEYERLGIPVPPRRPKLKRAEAFLNVGLGLLLVALSFLFSWSGIQMWILAVEKPDYASTLNHSAALEITWGAFLFACGIGLARLGWKAIREITRYESGADGVIAATRGTP